MYTSKAFSRDLSNVKILRDVPVVYVKIPFSNFKFKNKSFMFSESISILFFLINESIANGEKQRIILARALMKDSKILVLDEALSETDYFMEKTIINNIIKNFPYKTLIYVSHKKIDNLFDFQDSQKLWERLLLTNGLEFAKFASRTPAVETMVFLECFKYC